MAYDVSHPQNTPAREAHAKARLERLRSEILRGTYHVSSEELAESLIRAIEAPVTLN